MHALITGHDREHLFESAPLLGWIGISVMIGAGLMLAIVIGVQ